MHYSCAGEERECILFPSHRGSFPLASASISELTQRKGPGLLARTSQDTLQRRSFLHLSLASRLHCPLRLPRGSIHREGSPLGVSHGHERGGGRREGRQSLLHLCICWINGSGLTLGLKRGAVRRSQNQRDSEGSACPVPCTPGRAMHSGTVLCRGFGWGNWPLL